MSTKSTSIKFKLASATLSLLVLSPTAALAAPGGAGLPFETTFETIERSIQGIAPHLLVIAIVIAALALMYGEAGGMSRKVVGIVVGGASIVGVTTLVSTLFEGGGGLLF